MDRYRRRGGGCGGGDSHIFMVTRGPQAAAPTPTPTAAEIAAQRQAQDQKIRELAEGLVSEMMAVKEGEIRGELVDRQNKIEELQKGSGTVSAAPAKVS